MSDSVRPHRQQSTRLPRPWDSPGKNTGVGCHFLLQCLKVKMKVKSLSRVWLLATHGLQPTRLLGPWDFPGKSTGVGCHCLLRRNRAHLSNSQCSEGCLLEGKKRHRRKRSETGQQDVFWTYSPKVSISRIFKLTLFIMIINTRTKRHPCA